MAETADAPAPRKGRGRRIFGQIIKGLLITVAVVAVLGVVAYGFGGMWPRTRAMRTSYARLVAEGKASAITPRVVVPIPGCICHSNDPVLQAQHSTRRIRECSTCH